MHTADLYYYGCKRIEYEVDEECEEDMHLATVTERKVIEALDDDQKELFQEYSRVMKKIATRKGYLSFDKGFSIGLKLAITTY